MQTALLPLGGEGKVALMNPPQETESDPAGPIEMFLKHLLRTPAHLAGGNCYLSWMNPHQDSIRKKFDCDEMPSSRGRNCHAKSLLLLHLLQINQRLDPFWRLLGPFYQN